MYNITLEETTNAILQFHGKMCPVAIHAVTSHKDTCKMHAQ